MHTPRFYCPVPLQPGVPFDLPPAAAHHALRVLRLAVGDLLQLFDGSGAEYPARVIACARERCAVLPEPAEHPQVESTLQITLGQGLSQADKFDLVLQKAVELGVAALAPLSMRRSLVRLDADRAAKRRLHWQAVVVAACEQSGRVRIPAVRALGSLQDWLADLPPAALRLRLAPEAGVRVADLERPDAGVVLVVGPEGGFDPAEVAALDAAGFRSVRLGPRVLRTETAALAAIAALQAWHGDFGRADL